MTVLFIGRRERERIASLIKRARRRPVSLDVVRRGASDASYTLMLKDRKPGFERPSSEHMMLGDHRVTFSFEYQPFGLCRHLSVSVPRPGRAPRFEVVEIIAKEFGFHEFPPAVGRVWMEEFDPGHMAVNIVELVVPLPEGRA